MSSFQISNPTDESVTQLLEFISSMQLFDKRIVEGVWFGPREILSHTYKCSYCEVVVGSKLGYTAHQMADTKSPMEAQIYICPVCNAPTFFDDKAQKSFPGNLPGNRVNGAPEELDKLYMEARLAASAGAYTASVMACRKMLMNIAVEEGAKEGESFQKYVDYLAQKGFVPPHGKGWVDHIRNLGNDANHHINLMTGEDATRLITFVEMLLRFIYEFPSMLPKP
jgi:hypothetical protein